MIRIVVLAEILVIAAASAAAWGAERSGSSGEVAIQILCILTAVCLLPRSRPLSPFQLLPWLVLAATWFLPFFPGLYGPYPPTRFIFVIGLGVVWKDLLPRGLLRPGPAILGTIVVFSLFAARSFQLHADLIYGYDLAHVLNILHNTMDGRFWFSDLTNGSILSHHLFLTLAVIAPLVRVFDSAWFPQALQILLLAGGSLLLFAAARSKFGEIAAGAALWSIILHPLLAGQALHEIDPGVLGTFGVYVALFGWATNRTALFWCGAIWAILSKEHFGAAGIMTGLVFLFAPETRRRGILLMSISGASIVLFLLLAQSGQEGFNLALQWKIRFGDPGSGGGIQSAIEHVIQPNRIGYPLHLFLSNGFVSIAGWPLLIPALPEIGFNLISRFPMFKLAGHYATLTLPFLMMATAWGISRLNRHGEEAAYYVTACAIAATILANLTPFSHTGSFHDVFFRDSATRAETAAIRKLVSELPPGDVAVLGAHSLLVPLADRHPVTPLLYINMSSEITKRKWIIASDEVVAIPEGYKLRRDYGPARVYEKVD